MLNIRDVAIGVTTLVNDVVRHSPSDGISSYVNNLLDSFYPGEPVCLSFCSVDGVKIRQRYIEADRFALRVFSECLCVAGFTDIENRLSKCQLFHASDNLIPRFKKIAVLATLHDPIPLMHPEWTRGVLRKTKSILFKKTVQWADHYIAISDAIVPDLVQNFNINSDRITRVYHGVDAIYFQQMSIYALSQIKNKYSLNRSFFIFIGTLQPRKNLGRLLDAFLALPLAVQQAHPLVVVGRNGWSVDEDVRRLQNLQAQGRAVWLQGINDDEKRCLLQSALALVFPSLYEGFGLPILEAFASGLPVITSNVSAMPEVAGDAALLVNPLNVEQISHAMQRIAESPTLCFELSEKGRARAREFTWQKTAEQTLAVYREMM